MQLPLKSKSLMFWRLKSNNVQMRQQEMESHYHLHTTYLQQLLCMNLGSNGENLWQYATQKATPNVMVVKVPHKKHTLLQIHMPLFKSRPGQLAHSPSNCSSSPGGWSIIWFLRKPRKGKLREPGCHNWLCAPGNGILINHRLKHQAQMRQY